MLMKKIVFIVFVLLLSTNIFSNEDYIRAKKLYLKSNFKKAETILKKNIIGSKSHLPSLILMGKIFSKKNQFSKSLKIYLFLVKKFHTKKLADLKNHGLLMKELEFINKPNKTIKNLYFLMAQTFWKSYLSKVYSKETKTKILANAYKFFKISDYYGFKPKQTKFHLSLIQGQIGESDIAISNLTLLKKMILKEKNPNATNDLFAIDLMLSKTFSESKRQDIGTIFINNTKTKNYSNSARKKILKISTKESALFTLSYGKILDSNLYSTPKSLEKYESSSTKSIFNYSFRSKRKKELAYTLGLSYSQEEMENSKYRALDSRSYSLDVGLIKNQFLSNLGRLNYSFKNYAKKKTLTSPFQSELQVHSLKGSMLFDSSGGTIEFNLDLNGLDYKHQSDSLDIGIKSSFSPYIKSRLYSPLYAVGFNFYKNISLDSPTSEIFFSLTNNSRFYFLDLNLSSTLEYLYQYNIIPENNLHQINIEGLLTIPVKFIKNLYFYPSLKYELIKNKTYDLFSKWKGRAFISLSF